MITTGKGFILCAFSCIKSELRKNKTVTGMPLDVCQFETKKRTIVSISLSVRYAVWYALSLWPLHICNLCTRRSPAHETLMRARMLTHSHRIISILNPIDISSTTSPPVIIPPRLTTVPRTSTFSYFLRLRSSHDTYIYIHTHVYM